jgi:hypothetical protein
MFLRIHRYIFLCIYIYIYICTRTNVFKYINLCIIQVRQKKRNRLFLKISVNSKWIDTDRVSGFQQRSSTEVLRDRIYIQYFTKLVISIAIKAETIATERKLICIQEKMTVNKEGLMNRIKFIGVHSRDIQVCLLCFYSCTFVCMYFGFYYHSLSIACCFTMFFSPSIYYIQRDDLMRMRRSYLNIKYFPRHRYHVLKERFSGWVRFISWNKGEFFICTI